MTREENLHWIDEEIRTWENECQSKHPIKEALYAARKALEQELNTWSLDDAREDFMYDVYNTLDFLPTNDEANRIIDSFDMVTKGIKQEPRWIPVTERLPKEERNSYWICTDTGYQCECRWTNMNLFWSYETTDWHWNIADIPQYTEVVAWKPLPQPYKGEQEE
jgi:hypothetical protein